MGGSEIFLLHLVGFDDFDATLLTARRKYFRAFLMTVFETSGVELRVQ